MNMRRKLCWIGNGLLCLLLLLLASCGSQSGKVLLTRADQGKTVVAHVGDQITLQLDENPSTGYQWSIVQTDNQVLELQHSTYTPTPSGLVGSGGTRLFTFVAKKPGTVHLQLKLWRSFEGDASISDRYSVMLQIQR